MLETRQKQSKRNTQTPTQTEQPRVEEVEKSASKTRSNEGGSVIVDKVNETLDALLKAWSSRLTAETPIPLRLQEYPNALQEKINLVRNQ